MTSSHHIAIIGAGPTGLIAAQMLAQKNFRVTVYDRMASPARKLLIAGRGGLNLTHSELFEKFLTRYGDAAEWLAPAIREFPPHALREWCEDLGQPTYVGSSGRVFPLRMKAVELLRAWLQRLQQLGVAYAPRHHWQGWDGNGLTFATPNGIHTTHADATLLALGGASWPRLGSDGGWVSALRAQNICVADLRPSNCGFTIAWTNHISERFAGQPLKPVAVTHNGRTQQGEAMITDTGMEGGVIYALSSSIRDAIDASGSTQIQLDLRPGMTLSALRQKLDIPRGSKSLSTYLQKAGLSPLAISLLREAAPQALDDNAALAAAIKSLPLTLTGTSGITRAISSAGGIVRAELTSDFMLKNKPGVFVAGEMLDWEAPTGGYLLQACYSTGVAAAAGITRYLL